MTEIVLLSTMIGAVGAYAGRQMTLAQSLFISAAAVVASPFLGGVPVVVGAASCAAVAVGGALMDKRPMDGSARERALSSYRRLIAENADTPAEAPTPAPVPAGELAQATPVEDDTCMLLLQTEIAVNRLEKGSAAETLALDALLDSFQASNDDERDAALNQALMIANQAARNHA